MQTREVVEWISGLEARKRDRLMLSLDPARVISLMVFARALEGHGSRPRVAVISGSPDEPELWFLQEPLVSFFSFEDSSEWDLNQHWSDGRLGKNQGAFEIVLLEQVLEHVLRPAQAVANARLLLKEGGLLHISTPGINGTHGSPHYYYAGFHPRALEGFCEDAGFSSVETGGWGSKKSVQMYATCDWQPIAVSAFRELAKIDPRWLLGRILKGWRHWRKYGRLKLFPGKQYPHFTISWAFARA